VGAGVGTVVTGVGTGAGVVVHPAARMPTNKTAQTKNNKDFISLNIMICYKYLPLRCRETPDVCNYFGNSSNIPWKKQD
jgi:hypothetical protein